MEMKKDDNYGHVQLSVIDNYGLFLKKKNRILEPCSHQMKIDTMQA